MTNLRCFRNGDLPALAKIWSQHWSVMGPPPRTSTARLEQAIPSRPFFDPNLLWVAQTEGRMTAWCHAVRHGACDDVATLAAICIGNEADPNDAETLLSKFVQHAKSSGIRRLQAGVSQDDVFGYVGFEPIGYGIGIPVNDIRINSLLQNSGFLSQCTMSSLAATTDRYRPPVNRESLQLRRSTKTQMRLVVPRDLRRAAALSHLDIEQYLLLDRSGAELAALDFWFSDPEAEVMSPAVAIVDLSTNTQLTPEERFLMATVIQSLSARNVVRVETAIDSESAELVEQLQSLCFDVAETGVVWEKEL